MHPIDIATRDLADELAKRDDPCANRTTQMALLRVADELRKGADLRAALIKFLVDPLEAQIRGRAGRKG